MIKKIAVFSGMFIVLYGILSVFAILGQKIFEKYLGLGFYASLAPTIAIIILIYKYLERRMVEFTDRHIFPERFAYKNIVKHFLTEIITELDMLQVIQRTVDIVNKVFVPESFSIYVLDDKKDTFTNLIQNLTDSLAKDSPIIKYFIEQRINWISIADSRRKRCLPTDVSGMMDKHNAVFAYPLYKQYSELIGIMLLGRKQSGEDYSDDELEVLADLATTETLAIMNAQANEELAKLKTLKNLGTMADGMGHQFNNIFQCFTGQAGMLGLEVPDMLEESKPLDDKSRIQKLEECIAKIMDKVKLMEGDAKRGGNLARSVLIHTRPEKAGFKVQDITQTFDASFRLISFDHKDIHKVLEVSKEVPDNIPQTWANESLVQNVYQIAINNSYDAIKHKKENNPGFGRGSLVYKASYNEKDNLVQIDIIDNGMGMKLRTLEAVNQGVPYFTTKGSSAPKSGFGAGVHTLANYLGLLGARYKYQSVYGKGATLTIEIPVRNAPDKKGD